MLWGAGRLLWRAVDARKAVPTLLRGPLGSFFRSEPRRVWVAAAAVLAVALVGGGQPMVARVMGASRVPSPVRSTDAMAGAPDTGEQRDRSTFFASSVTLESAPVARPVLPPAPPVSHRTALIIGINRAKRGRPLPGSVTDAKNLNRALLGYGFRQRNITMLLDGQATRSRIRTELARLADRTPRDGIAVFAVATHTRKSGGQNEFLTADGLRISASELATALGRVRAKMWVALPTCYAGGYAVPGIIGRNRVATFASPSNQPTYQLGNAGSYLIINMVRKAMLEGRATESVERAFDYAEDTLEREHPNRVPTISDGIRGELVLGEMSSATIARARAKAAQHRRESSWRSEDDDPDPGVAFGVDRSQPEAEPYDPDDYEPADPYATPEPTPSPDNRRGVSVCGRVDYRC